MLEADRDVVLQAVGRVDPDGSRYLLGDTMGNLHMLVLSHDSQRVVGLKLEALGHISAPSTISYLDTGVVFVVCTNTAALMGRVHMYEQPPACAVHCQDIANAC